MAVKIRLKRMGKIRAPYYRIVVADSRTKRDGRVIEEIGKYHPKEDPSLIEVNSDRALYWLGVGAQPSEPVAAILKVTGDWQKFKGEAAPPPMLLPGEKRDKMSRFNEALKDSRFEPTAEAVTPRRPRKADAEPEAAAETTVTEAAESPAAPEEPAATAEPKEPAVAAEPTEQAVVAEPAEQTAPTDDEPTAEATADDGETAATATATAEPSEG